MCGSLLPHPVHGCRWVLLATVATGTMFHYSSRFRLRSGLHDDLFVFEAFDKEKKEKIFKFRVHQHICLLID